LKHKFVTVTPDNPGTPGQVIDPANPDGPKYPAGTTTADLTTSVSQTIKYQYQNGDVASAANVQIVTFNRNATIDEVDNTLVYTDWVTGDAATGRYETVVSPVITGYTADKTSVAGNDAVAKIDSSKTIIVTYHVKSETAMVVYVDQTTGQTIKTVPLQGDYGTTDVYTTADKIAAYENAGYELVSSTFPTAGVVYDKDGTVKTYTVTLKHKFVTVTPDKPGTPGQPIDPANPDGPKYPAGTTTADLTNQVKQTIKYQYQNGDSAETDNVQTMTFDRHATIDEVDGTLVYTNWLNGDSTTAYYPAVASPVITGYTADKTNVTSTDPVTGTDLDTVVIVTYKVNTEKATVAYVDTTTGQTLYIADVKGDYNTQSTYRTAETIAKYVKAGYELVGDNYPTNGVMFDEDGTIKSYTVTLKHKLVTVTPADPGTPGQPIDPANPDGPKYPAGTTAQALTKQVSQTIKYQYQNGTVAGASNVQTVTFNRNVTIDEVDNTLVYTDWLTGSTTTGQYATVDSPVIIGYTTDKTSVAGNDAVTSTAQDTMIVVMYAANPETATVTYIDATTGQTLDFKILTGDFNTSSDYRTTDTITNYIKVGYALVASDYPATGVIFDEDGAVKAYTVTLKHKLVTVTPADPGTPGQPIDPANPDGPKYPAGTTAQALTKQVSQTIKYQYQNGTAAGASNVQTITFNRNATIDEVDGTLVYTAWLAGNSKTGQYVTVDSPVITGYTADKTSIAGNNAVVNTVQDKTEIVTYLANLETTTVTYIDTTTGQMLDVVTLTGNFASQSAYRTADVIAKYVKNGYILVRDEYPTSGVTFNADGVVHNYFVRLAHAIDSTTATKTITQTVHYQNMAGTQLHADTVRTITFIRAKSVDNVTGEVTYGNWSTNQAGNRFETVTAMTIPGYQPTITGTQVVTVTPGSVDDVQTIRYVADTTTTGETPKTPVKTITVKTPDEVKTVKPTQSQNTKQVAQTKQPGNIDRPVRAATADATAVKLAKTKTVKPAKAMSNRKSTATHKQATLPQTNDDRQASVVAEILGLITATLLVGLGALLKKRRD
ncbi:mucus-binding protein, partial [Lactiplantibacillus sp. DA1]|nr:mucus-binding protein [Lactiplantibacillus sp. DA1]